MINKLLCERTRFLLNKVKTSHRVDPNTILVSPYKGLYCAFLLRGDDIARFVKWRDEELFFKKASQTILLCAFLAFAALFSALMSTWLDAALCVFLAFLLAEKIQGWHYNRSVKKEFHLNFPSAEQSPVRPNINLLKRVFILGCDPVYRSGKTLLYMCLLILMSSLLALHATQSDASLSLAYGFLSVYCLLKALKLYPLLRAPAAFERQHGLPFTLENVLELEFKDLVD